MAHLKTYSWTRNLLEHVEQPLPAHLARMNHRVDVSRKTLGHVPRLPYFLRRINGHVNHQRRPDNIRARHEAPVAAVVGILPIVAHHEIFAGRNAHRWPRLERVRRILAVRFVEGFPVDVHHALLHLQRIARQTNDAFDEIRISRQGRAEHDYLLPLRFAPKRHVPVGEWNARVVPDAAYDQVIADQHGALHRAARDDARLHQRPFDQQERDNHPEPGKHFPPDLILQRYRSCRHHISHCHRFFHLSPHDEPPLRVAPAQSDSCWCSTTCRIFLPYLPPPPAATRATGTRANRRPGIGGFPRRIFARRSILRGGAYQLRNSTAKL